MLKAKRKHLVGEIQVSQVWHRMGGNVMRHRKHSKFLLCTWCICNPSLRWKDAVFWMMTRVTLIWGLVREFRKALKFIFKEVGIVAVTARPKELWKLMLVESSKRWKTCCYTFLNIFSMYRLLYPGIID